tara:strand:+ start:5183 stop:5521 length:339 start_codon:yes stop_codon:yes gene_type:complete
MERDEYTRLRLSLKKIKEEVSHIEQTIENIKIRKITEGLTYAEWAANQAKEEQKKSIQEALVEHEEKEFEKWFEEEHNQKFDKLTFQQSKDIGIKFSGTYEDDKPPLHEKDD